MSTRIQVLIQVYKTILNKHNSNKWGGGELNIVMAPKCACNASVSCEVKFTCGNKIINKK